jgi:photosystem II stability/assembly factor-like uncharacterized protein
MSNRPPARLASFVLALLVISTAWSAPLPAQQSPVSGASLFGEMKWRSIGPFRGGRTRAAAGVTSQPYTFYIGVCDGGVWKTTDAGRTWAPIFDDQPTGSIGSVAVAPSDPNVIYVGSGEGLARPDLSVGDGFYRSTDAGTTWTHLGLRDGQQIPQIAVDPKNPKRLFVAVAGHPYGPNEERGIFRSTNGGESFDKVLFKDQDTGGNDVDIDPSNPDIVYATLWEERQGPWENAQWRGGGGGIYKSIDGGTTWRHLLNGLPEGVTQVNLAIAPSNPNRLYATVAVSAGVTVYRSDDGGEIWTKATTDTRPAARIGGGDLSMPVVNPKDPDTLIITSTVTWKSTDGGKTWAAFRGAPGGDDYQNAWINPNDPNIILLVSDQGALVTLNGGDTWSSWYNQPTAQLYHVMADNAFPYRVCSGQQESGSVCVSSRGNDGQITMREWHPVGAEEYGYVAPDPLDPDLVYGGKVTRYDRRTGTVSSVGPLGGGRGGVAAPAGTANVSRTVRTQPLVFSTVDPHALFYATNVLWKTLDGGHRWRQISPDLTRATWSTPKTVGTYLDQSTAQPSQRGVIYTIGPSYVDVDRIWIGTDDGLIQTTADGGLHWKNVTPPQITAWMKVFMIDPGHFDTRTAYAAVNTLRLDDMRPHLFRTHDSGATWTEISHGMPNGVVVNTIREDPKKKGLLFAGSDTQAYVSFDDGDDWQSLRLNMGATSIRDMIIKDDDLVAATHGRGFWILDDITPLRQIDAKTADTPAVLFKPEAAYRVRWSTNSDTPIPPDESTGANPPEGAILNYCLKSDATGPITLEVWQSDGKPVRRYSSTDPIEKPDPATNPLPLFWYRPAQSLSTSAGMHRFMWDMHYQPLSAAGGGRGGGISSAAVGHNTGPAPSTPWVAPGDYIVRLTVNGKTYSQPLTVKIDPRVRASALALQQVFSLTKWLYYGAVESQAAGREAASIREQIAKLQEQAQGPAAQALADLEKLSASLQTSSAAAAQIQSIKEQITKLQPKGPSPIIQALAEFDKKVAALQGAAGAGARGDRGAGAASPAPAPPETLLSIVASLSGLMNSMQSADVAPTALTLTAIGNAQDTASSVMLKWNALKTVDLPLMNVRLKAAGLPPITLQ